MAKDKKEKKANKKSSIFGFGKSKKKSDNEIQSTEGINQDRSLSISQSSSSYSNRPPRERSLTEPAYFTMSQFEEQQKSMIKSASKSSSSATTSPVKEPVQQEVRTL
jgi:hypothetical protein